MFKMPFVKKPGQKKRKEETEPRVPLMDRERPCKNCGALINIGETVKNYYVCPVCGEYFRIHARRRLEMILDRGTFEEWDAEMPAADPLDFPGYEEKIRQTREKTRLDEAVVTGRGKISGYDTVIGVCDNRYFRGSMGHNMGEKITRAVERATSLRLPVILYVASGGARMQEGMVSLLQMAKTAAALKRHSEAGLLYVSFLTNPTTGGVTASFGMLGDIILAEPKALIGFAGPRVIEQTIRQKLPEGFQRAEFQLKHGFVDAIVERKDQKDVLSTILKLHSGECGWQQWTSGGTAADPGEGERPAGNSLTGRMDPEVLSRIEARRLDPWDVVHESRMMGRPTALSYMEALFDDFEEWHGDRCFGDDGAVIGGIASFEGMPVTVIGEERGRAQQEVVQRNFGMPSPEGYRKALRLMKEAEKFSRPVICFVDTSGAYPGKEAEERGQGEAIARNLFEMADLKVPILAVIIGQGNSGGALAIAVADEVWMLENATYSILSPEGFASILWKDSNRADEASRVMKMTAKELYDLGLIDRIICEDEPASMENIGKIRDDIAEHMRDFFASCSSLTPEELTERRYGKYRRC